MLDLIHKLLYTGIGFAAFTEQRARDFVAELEKRGDISSEEGKKLAQDLVDKAKRQADELRKTVHEEVNKFTGRIHPVSREEFNVLKQRVEELEARLCPDTGDESL